MIALRAWASQSVCSVSHLAQKQPLSKEMRLGVQVKIGYGDSSYRLIFIFCFNITVKGILTLSKAVKIHA